jgi:hypothetical protein
VAPTLERVKAHDDEAVEEGLPKAVENDKADRLADQAVLSAAI